MYGQHMNSLDEICQAVWAAKDINDKKNLFLRAISSFKYKEKQDLFAKNVKRENKAERLDAMAANLILNKTDKVVDLIPR